MESKFYRSPSNQRTTVIAFPASIARGKVRWTLLIVIVVAALIVGLLFSATAKRNASSEVDGVKSVIHLEPFVLNLADPNQKAYLRVGIDIGVEHPPTTSEASAAATALLRDTVIDVLARGEPEVLLSSEGKIKLKSDLVQALRQRMPTLAVKEVYFTEFLIQR